MSAVDASRAGMARAACGRSVWRRQWMCFRRLRSTSTSRSVFFFDRGQRAEGDRRLARHHARAGDRRLSHVAVCDRGRRGHRRAAARQGHDLQGRDGGPAVRRRQDGDHRRSQDRQVRGAVPRARPRDRHARRPLLHRRGRRHRPRGHGLRRARRPATCWAARAAAAAATRRRSRRAASGSGSAPPSGTSCSATISPACAWRSRAWATSATTSRGCSPRTAPG